MRFPLPLLLIIGVLVCGCSRGIQNEAAVRQGVIDYLSSKSDINVSSMQVEVTSVSFRENEADATVSFKPKGGGAAGGMQLRYTLERKGNRWVVKGKGLDQPGASAHGAGQTPGGQAEGQMPPGHPPVAGQPQKGAQGGQESQPPKTEPPKK